MACRLYILYNADASIMGKLNYGYRKLCKPSSSTNPACAACDITHGGLSLSESEQWTSAKADMMKDYGAGLKISQLHRDEVKEPLKTWIMQTGVKYPAVVRSRGDQDSVDSFELLVTREELAQCGGEPKALVKILRGKGTFGEQASL